MKNFHSKYEFGTLVQANQKNRHQAVLRAASELFAEKQAPSRDDILHFEELCLRLLPKLSLDAKAEVAERLAMCQSLPRATALALAKEDICVAAPVLRYFEGFTDDDLLVILANGTELHALAISSRNHVSDTIMIALSRLKLPHFDHSVEDKKTKMPEAEQSQARLDMDVEIPGDENSNLNMALDRLALLASGNNTKANEELDLGKLDRFLALEHAHILTKVHEIEQRAAGSDVNPAAVLKKAYRRAERAVEFVKLARSRNVSGFADLMSSECGLNQRSASRITKDPKGFALAICLKSLALPAHVANEAFLLLNPTLGEDTDQVFLLAWFYGQITPTGAHVLLNQWRDGTQDTNKAHQPVHDGKPHAEVRRRQTQSERHQATDQRTKKLLSNR